MGAVDALVNRIFAHRDCGYFDVWLLAFLIIIVRPLAEGAFIVSLFRRHDAFDDNLGARGNHETHRFRPNDFQGLAEESTGDLQLLPDSGLLADGGHVQCRVVTNGQRDFHRLIVIFVFGPDVVAVIGWIDHQAELPLTLLLMAVNAHVDGVGAPLFADQRRCVDVTAGVPFVVSQNRQQIEVNVIVFQDDFFYRRVLCRDFPYRKRIMFPLRQIFDHLRDRRRTERQRQPLISCTKINDEGEFRVFDILEEYQRKLVFTFEFFDDGAGFVMWIDLAIDDDNVLGPPL